MSKAFSLSLPALMLPQLKNFEKCPAMELVEVTPDIMADINTELSPGAQIPLPYKSWRQYSQVMGSGDNFQADISESATNINAIYSVIREQNAGSTIKPSITDRYKQIVNDPYQFVGGNFNRLDLLRQRALHSSGVIPIGTDLFTTHWRPYTWKVTPLLHTKMSSLDLDRTIKCL